MSSLREELERHGLPLKDLTVLADQNDPFRVDTPVGHRDGAWLGDLFEQVRATVHHLRGLHYALVSIPGLCRPDGQPYANDDRSWQWMSERAAKFARWLGYIDFDDIEDERNDRPVIHRHEAADPRPFISVGLEVSLPEPEDLEPYVGAFDFVGRQPYRLVMWGEKNSLRQVLAPVAERYQADLYLSAGELSDTQLHTMAKEGAADGRPMIVFTFSDCDPSGWNMPISISRKLQAFKTMRYPSLEFRVHRVGLTPDQVRAYGLPSTPLKESEKRAGRWTSATGVEQSEVDAWLTLAGDAIRTEAEAALGHYFDATLQARVEAAKWDWQERAQAVVDASTDANRDALVESARQELDAMRAKIDALNNEIQIDAHDFDLPEIVIPQPMVSGAYGLPLVDSSWSFVEQCRALKASRNYEIGGAL